MPSAAVLAAQRHSHTEAAALCAAQPETCEKPHYREINPAAMPDLTYCLVGAAFSTIALTLLFVVTVWFLHTRCRYFNP